MLSVVILYCFQICLIYFYKMTKLYHHYQHFDYIFDEKFIFFKKIRCSIALH